MVCTCGWEQYGYRVERELGKNITGGRVTYLATQISSSESVVIKQFQFATVNSSWSSYNAYESEIAVLKSLDHPSIPAYLDSFETDTGFCLVQEYKQALPVSEPYRWTFEEIKEVTISILEVLVYLQKQQPAVIHRDIKPENILVDRSKQLKVYLVDFGFARIGGGEVAVSSVVKGTLGFMPPEQMFNRQLNNASDLYGLGATIICLLTNTKSQDIGQLLDYDTNNFKVKTKLAKLNPAFVVWLEKMVSSNFKNRYANAQLALESLTPISLYIPKANKNKLTLETKIVMGVLLVFSFLSIHKFLSTLSGGINYSQKQLDLKHFRSQIFELATGNCVGCNLEGAYFAHQTLSHSDLAKANLKNARLQYANISSSFLDHANLEKSDFTEANLSNTSLRKANFKQAKLINANLSGANLTNTNLEKANLENVNFYQARLHETNFYKANLVGADFSNANLYDTNFQYANLTNALLPKDYEQYASFRGAIMPNGKVYKLK